MIISQIMLTGLARTMAKISMAKPKKSPSRKIINLKFIATVDQVMDSMLVKHLITPVLRIQALTRIIF